MTDSTSRSRDVLALGAFEQDTAVTAEGALAGSGKILASPATSGPLRCPDGMDVVVDGSDSRTHKIPAHRGNPFVVNLGGDHFVTVKGGGDVVLRAQLPSDSQDLMSRLTWESDGRRIDVGEDRRIARISRETEGGERIVVRLSVGGKKCKEFTVWIIWCTLTPDITQNKNVSIENVNSGTSERITLGLHKRRTPSGINVRGRIEWTARIYPPEIITDPDRPAIDTQPIVDVPLSRGVAGPTHKDGTGSGFSGWDMSRQKKRKVVKGIPLGNPPSPLGVASESDNVPTDRLLRDYPRDELEGNDDSNTSFSDTFPYGPGGGRLGILRSFDTPSKGMLDSENSSGGSPALDGDSYSKKLYLREFVRVQLGDTWYRCSDWGEWRFTVSVKRVDGKWQFFEGDGLKNLIALNNEGF